MGFPTHRIATPARAAPQGEVSPRPMKATMTDPGDWEPLSEQDLTRHPGEFAEPPPPTKEQKVPKDAAPDPEAERLLQRLIDRIASAPPPANVLSGVQRKERRKRRLEHAVTTEQFADAEPVRSEVTERDLPLDVEFAPGEDGRDPREDEAWFRALPAGERERLHQSWSHKRVQALDNSAAQRRVRNRRLTAGIVVFAATALLGTRHFWHATLGAGVICGIWWRHSPPDRFRDPLLAFVCLLVLQMLAWGVGGGDPPQGLFMDAILVVALATVVGFDGEIRRTGGFDAR